MPTALVTCEWSRCVLPGPCSLNPCCPPTPLPPHHSNPSLLAPVVAHASWCEWVSPACSGHLLVFTRLSLARAHGVQFLAAVFASSHRPPTAPFLRHVVVCVGASQVVLGLLVVVVWLVTVVWEAVWATMPRV